MNKNAFIGKLIFLAFVFTFSIVGFAYLAFKEFSVQFKTGKVTLNVNYNALLNESNSKDGIEIIDARPRELSPINIIDVTNYTDTPNQITQEMNKTNSTQFEEINDTLN